MPMMMTVMTMTTMMVDLGWSFGGQSQMKQVRATWKMTRQPWERTRTADEPVVVAPAVDAIVAAASQTDCDLKIPIMSMMMSGQQKTVGTHSCPFLPIEAITMEPPMPPAEPEPEPEPGQSQVDAVDKTGALVTTKTCWPEQRMKAKQLEKKTRETTKAMTTMTMLLMLVATVPVEKIEWPTDIADETTALVVIQS